MIKISADSGKELYKVWIISPSGNVVIADEPEEAGGRNAGFSPEELLASALAACTSATLRMYAGRKQWDLEEVKIVIELQRDEVANKTVINRQLEFIGNLNEEQRAKLISIANACPVHKVLSNPIEINTVAI